MPHIEPLSDDQAAEAAKTLFQPLQSAFGMVPNIFRTMAHAPDVLAALLNLNNAIQQKLPAKFRELAYLKTSLLNDCRY
jgi:alkylhydroperoxidase family enzyme